MCVCSFVEYNDRVEMRISWDKRKDTNEGKQETHNTRGFAQLNGISVRFTPDTLTSVPPIFFLFRLFPASLVVTSFFVALVFYSIPSLLDIWSDLRSVWMWSEVKCSHRAWSSSSRMNASLVEISHIIISIYQKRENIYIFHYPMLCVPLSARNVH